MSSGSKFGRGTNHGRFRPPQNRGLVPLRNGSASNRKTAIGQRRDAAASNRGTPTNGQEESFQLLAHPSTMGQPFAMIIRLQPEILEELKQAEADDIQVLMKFGTNATGHIIQVGSETFKFSSAPEPGDLCDIYEQKQGELGEAVLVEAGSAWRKLSVQRILSAVEKDRVKKRTAEAEKQQKQRKSILVDSSTQMIIPQAGAADANCKKPASKEPPLKKQRVSASSIRQRAQTTSTIVNGTGLFTSPASPIYDPPTTSGRGIQMHQMNDSYSSKGGTGSERVAGRSPSIQKEKPRTSAASAVPEIGKSGSATSLTDLHNFLISFLQENSKGVTIKAIERAMPEALCGVADKRALDKVMKSIASYHAPGRYLLNAGVEKGSFLEPGTPLIAARALEAVTPTTQEAEPLNSDGVLERESVKDKEDLFVFDRGLSSVVSHDSIKEASAKHMGAQPFHSTISDEDLIKQESAHVLKDSSTGASGSSSSSGSGSGSDCCSDSSGTGSATASGSGTGSDSDSSNSGGKASMDEDVDIMSDDDVEKGRLDAKQKPKVRESLPVMKTDIRSNKLEEHHNSIYNYPEATLGQANDLGNDLPAKSVDNVFETVFGSDEADDLEEDSGEHIRDKYSKQEKESKYGERKAPVKDQVSKDAIDLSNLAEPQGISIRNNGASGVEGDSDNLVEEMSRSKIEVGSLESKRGCLCSSHQKVLQRSGSPAPGEDNDKGKVDTEYISCSNFKKRGHGAYCSSDGRSMSKRGSEVDTLLNEGPQMDTEEPLLKIAKTSSETLSQAGAEARKDLNKLALQETHEKFERGKAPEVLLKGMGTSNVVRGTGGSENALEDTSKLDDGGIDRLSDRGGVQRSGYSEMKKKKDKAMEERILDGPKVGDMCRRQSREFETQHLQQKDVGPLGKESVHRVSRKSNHLSAVHDRDLPHVHKSCKVSKHSGQKGESLDRARLVVEQAERALEDAVFTRKENDMYGKGILIEGDAGGRPYSDECSIVVAKEAARFGERLCAQETCRASQSAEFKDPLFKNGSLETLTPLVEDSRSKVILGTTNRLSFIGSLSPDQDDFQPLDRRSSDMRKQSPVRILDDSSHHVHEPRSTERGHEETESSEMERSKRRAGAGGQVKQLQHKDEWFQGEQNHIEKGRFSGFDSQEYAGASKFSALENDMRSDEDLDELCRQKRASQTHVASNDSHRNNLKVGVSMDNSKRHYPQSTDEVEGYEFFAPYEKQQPNLRGLINTFQEYKDYCKEYRQKYPIYIKLNGVIEHIRKPFESLRKDMERASYKDDERKLAHTCAIVRHEYAVRHKKRKRMFHTFRVLHEELKVIKTRCKEYAEKVGQG